MANWLHRFLNPHCEHCAQERKDNLEHERLLREMKREEYKEETICESCETYKRQLEIANHNNEKLMEKLLKDPEKVVESGPVPISRPTMMPWKVRQQLLEQEDKAKALALRNAPKPVKTTEELEQALGVDTPQPEEAANV